MEPGLSLRDQLRKAINLCDVCIFLATPRSIESDWCAAEIGAFWGGGKRVIMFKADPAVDANMIPPQFKDDLWTSDIRDVIRVVQQDLAAAAEKRKQDAARRPRLVADMTIATLYDVLASLKSQFLDSLPLPEVMRLIYENISNNLADAEATMQPLMKHLIGVPREILEETASIRWPAAFVLKTSTGDWMGFAKSTINHQLIDGYSHCLLILCDTKHCVAAAAVGAVLQQDTKIDYDSIIASAGDTVIGDARQLSLRLDIQPTL